MKYLPIKKDDLGFERLDLSRNYLQIDCDFICYIVLNPSGDVPLGGTDVCALHVGSWQIDCWSFLTDKFTKGTAGFSACLCWDKTLESGTAFRPQYAESDIDTANSISSLRGQPVNITGFSLADGLSLPVTTVDGQPINVVTVNPISVQNSFLFESSYIDRMTQKEFLSRFKSFVVNERVYSETNAEYDVFLPNYIVKGSNTSDSSNVWASKEGSVLSVISIENGSPVFFNGRAYHVVDTDNMLHIVVAGDVVRSVHVIFSGSDGTLPFKSWTIVPSSILAWS